MVCVSVGCCVLWLVVAYRGGLLYVVVGCCCVLRWVGVCGGRMVLGVVLFFSLVVSVARVAFLARYHRERLIIKM